MSPLYSFTCPGCLNQTEVLTTVAQRDDPVLCDCGSPMVRVEFPGCHAIEERVDLYLPSEEYLPRGIGD